MHFDTKSYLKNNRNHTRVKFNNKLAAEIINKIN
jgi:hypothetical protein